ncbi:MAG: hypothetical protein SAJ37_18800 [Oscillatoria sp. PMC 1068.18]|nr:hypothetical protein [Oscillatoria sp. PMC 1076.18]MEC4990787.1 hypothetical protein [Oscillatoria sp. PMC 1068.18]
MATATLFPNAPDVSAEDYCVFGLATCFLRDEGEITEVQVIEPIPSAALEAILKGIPTSYKFAIAQPIGEFFADDNLHKPTEFPADAQFSDNFTERVVAAARSYKNRPEAQKHLPLGTSKDDFNYSLERKRVLNSVNVVSTEDNVKQHAYTHKVL